MGDYNENDHPRNPAGSAGGRGGRYRMKAMDGDDRDLTGMPAGEDDGRDLRRLLEDRLERMPLPPADLERARRLLQDTHPIRRGEDNDMPLFAAWAFSRIGWEGSEHAGRLFDAVPFRFDHPDRLRDQVKTGLFHRAVKDAGARPPAGVRASYAAATHELRLTDHDHRRWTFRQRSISEAEATVLARKMNGDYGLPDPGEAARFDRMEESGDFGGVRLESDGDRERWTRLCLSKYNLDDHADDWRFYAYGLPVDVFDPDSLLDPAPAGGPEPRGAPGIRAAVAERAAVLYGDDLYRGYERDD